MDPPSPKELAEASQSDLIGDEDVKHCSLPENRIARLEKETSVRKITATKKWTLDEHHYLFETQINILKYLLENLVKHESETEIYTLLRNEIKHKIHSYRSQDVLKQKYQESQFVDFPFVLHSLVDSDLDCFYCQKKVTVFYKNVREPLQWSLERLDNDMGHNKDNVVIACLLCNLRRRTMYHGRFLYAKQFGVVKKCA